MKLYVIQSKNGIMMNFRVCVNNLMIWVLVKRVMCGILASEIVNVIKHVKFPYTKNCSL